MVSDSFSRSLINDYFGYKNLQKGIWLNGSISDQGSLKLLGHSPILNHERAATGPQERKSVYRCIKLTNDDDIRTVPRCTNTP